MTTDPLQLLSRANPVPALPQVEEIEYLRALIEEREELVSAPLSSIRRRRRLRLRGRSPAIVLAISALAGLGLLLGDGSSGPGTNVLAAAYAATSGGGLLEARYVTRLINHGHFTGGFSSREWIEPSRDRRRQQMRRSQGAARRASTIFEIATRPGWIETWSNSDPNRVGLLRDRHLGIPSAEPRREDSLNASAGIELFRKLYREESLRVVGRERHKGRLLWKLEGYVAFASRGTGKPLTPVVAVVVLLDPHTYLPVVQRQVDLHPVRRTASESVLGSYRRLAADRAGEALLSLAAQHPKATVTRPSVSQPLRRSAAAHRRDHAG
jgi:hypothetical protein